MCSSDLKKKMVSGGIFLLLLYQEESWEEGVGGIHGLGALAGALGLKGLWNSLRSWTVSMYLA